MVGLLLNVYQNCTFNKIDFKNCVNKVKVNH